jgi:hypothetical protein
MTQAFIELFECLVCAAVLIQKCVNLLDPSNVLVLWKGDEQSSRVDDPAENRLAFGGCGLGQKFLEGQ